MARGFAEDEVPRRPTRRADSRRSGARPENDNYGYSNSAAYSHQRDGDGGDGRSAPRFQVYTSRLQKLHSFRFLSQCKAAEISAKELRLRGWTLRGKPDPDAVGQREDARHRSEDASRHRLARATAASAVSAADAPQDGLRGRVGLQVDEGPRRPQLLFVPGEARRIVGHLAAPEGEAVPAERQ